MTHLDRLDEAEAALRAVLQAAEADGVRLLVVRSRAALSIVLRKQRRFDEADELIAAAHVLVGELALQAPDGPAPELGGASFQTNFLQAMTALLPRLRVPTPLRAAKQRNVGLTAREREVAILVAQGKSNPEIAAALLVGHRTAQTHVANILRKLGCTSRAQVAAWVASRGLLDTAGYPPTFPVARCGERLREALENVRRSTDAIGRASRQTHPQQVQLEHSAMRITVNETELYFDVEGSALVPDGIAMRERPTMVVLHGGPGFDHAYFKPALSELADTVQIVYLDLRGQGRSGRPPLESCTLEQMADDVAAFCETLGIYRPVVLGHSAGGFVGLHLAVRHPDVIGRLILVDTAAATADMRDAMATLEERHGPDARAAAERMFGGDFSESAMTDFMRLVFPAYVCDPSKIGAVGAAVSRSAFNPEVASYYFAHRAPLYDLRAQLGQIRVPTLVVVGDYDWLTPPAASKALAAGIPHAELSILQGAGHFAFLEQLELWSTTVRQFVTAAVPVGVGGI